MWTAATLKVETKGSYGQKPEAMSQGFVLTFNAKSVKGKMIEGKPFGCDIVSSRYTEAKP